MQPLGYDNRTYYRKHQVGEEVDVAGNVTPIYETDGPYVIAFRPGSASRIQTEQGYSYDQEVYFCICDGVNCFEAGDVLTDGENDLYKLFSVKSFPTDQTFYVRAL